MKQLQNKIIYMMILFCFCSSCGTRDYKEVEEISQEQQAINEKEEEKSVGPITVPVEDDRTSPVPQSSENSPSEFFEALNSLGHSVFYPLRDPVPEPLALEQIWFWYILTGSMGSWLIVRLTDDRNREQKSQTPDHKQDEKFMHPLHRKIHHLQGGLKQGTRSSLVGGALGLCTLVVSHLLIGDHYDAFVFSAWSASLVGLITRSGFQKLKERDNNDLIFLRHRLARAVAISAAAFGSGAASYLLLVVPAEDKENIKLRLIDEYPNHFKTIDPPPYPSGPIK